MKRSDFLKTTFLAAAGGLAAGPLLARGAGYGTGSDLTILYTNDIHSRIDPFPDNSLHYAGQGGFSRRATLVQRIRAYAENTLLLDAGDLLQGTPWFHRFGGEVEFELMNRLGYDAMCIGEADLSNGLEGFTKVAESAGFPVLCANYQVNYEPLQRLMRESVVRDYGEIRVGIFGLGIDPAGVPSAELSGAIRFADPVDTAGRMIRVLREDQGCNYVICLSHLGYRYTGNQIDDRKLALRAPGINLIIGGHTHTFLDQPEEILQPDGSRTWVTQMGHSGIRLGRVDLELTDEGTVRERISQFYTVGPERPPAVTAG